MRNLCGDTEKLSMNKRDEEEPCLASCQDLPAEPQPSIHVSADSASDRDSVFIHSSSCNFISSSPHRLPVN